MRVTLILFLFSFVSRAQIDSAIFVPILSIHVGGQLPGGDLSKRFGPNLNVGSSFMFKTKKNWIFGVEYNYMYGRNVREDVLVQLKTENGTIIDNEGYPADIRITERGFGVHIVGGKVFKFLSANPNSGLMVTVGGGYLQHKINLFDYQKKIAAVKGDLKNGYDRLTNGFSTSQFLGYMFLSDNKMLNFYFGFEFYQAFTKSVRKMNYDTGLADTQSRLDLLYGFRFGWILPLYKKTPREFYYD
ncbi:MAG: hypothetical protein H0W61_00885 [Bacteroidetes bacterium]|nr:hypothetical protein [Bacteroidota bacterium]